MAAALVNVQNQTWSLFHNVSNTSDSMLSRIFYLIYCSELMHLLDATQRFVQVSSIHHCIEDPVKAERGCHVNLNVDACLGSQLVFKLLMIVAASSYVDPLLLRILSR
jgi:hypothetical protein